MVQRLCVSCRSRVRDDGQAILFTPVRRNASQHSCLIYLDSATRSTSTRCCAETEELPCHKPPHLSKSQILCCLSVNRTPIGSKELTTVHGTSGMSTHWPLSSLMHRVGDTSGIESGIELKRGKLYDRQPTGRAPLEIFSVVLIISSRICPWKRRFEQRSEEERDADQRRNDKTPNSRLMETVALLLSSLSRDGGRRTTRIAQKEMGVLVPKQRSRLRRRRRTSRLAPSFSASMVSSSSSSSPSGSVHEWRRPSSCTGRWHPVDCTEGEQSGVQLLIRL